MPKVKDRKVRAVSFKISEQDLQRIKAATDMYGMTITDLIMRSIDAYIEGRKEFEALHMQKQDVKKVEPVLTEQDFERIKAATEILDTYIATHKPSQAL